MKTIKNTIAVLKALSCIALFSFMFSCEDEKGVVISQDTEWTIDSKYIEEDIREQLGIDPYTNLVYFGYYSSPMINLTGNHDMSHLMIKEGNEVAIKVKIARAVDKDLTLRLVADNTLLGASPVDLNEYAELPSTNFSLEPQLLKAGETEIFLKISLVDVDALNQPGYALALTLELDGEHDHLKVSEIRRNIFLKLDVTFVRDNIDSSDEAIEGEMFNKDVVFDSNTTPEKLYSLNDGSLVNKWYTKEGTYLIMQLPEKTLLKGIKIETSSSNSYSLRTARVFTFDGFKWVDNGIFERAAMGTVAYIRFKSPTECLKIRLEDIYSFGNPGKLVDFNEVIFIK